MDSSATLQPELWRSYSREGTTHTERLNAVPQPPNVIGRGRYIPASRFAKKGPRSAMEPSVDEAAQRKALERL